MVSVFTPTYNRAHLIKRLYESLKMQTIRDFEWIVVDDGSTDSTDEIFEGWLNGHQDFQLRYIKACHGGKHRAINRAISAAKGEAFFIVDSDDYLLPNAIERIDEWFRTVEDDDTFAAVSGLKGYSKDEPVGGYGNFEGHVDCTNLERREYNLWEDKAEVYKTALLRQYPFPEFEGEDFITESVVWDRIAADGYKIRWYNEVIYICQYLEDGLSVNISKKFLENPKGALLYLNSLEAIRGSALVDPLRLRYYSDLLQHYENERAFEIISMANDIKAYQGKEIK